MNINRIFFLIVIFALSLKAQTLDEKVASTFNFAEQQILGTLAEVDTNKADRFPRWVDITKSGKWINNLDYKWTSGFFPGCLWFMYEHSQDVKWKNHARQWTSWLKDVNYSEAIVMPSFGNGHRFGKDTDYIPLIVEGANQFVKNSWNADARILDSWDRVEWLNNPDVISGTVDQLIGNEFLFYAGTLSNDTTLTSIATAFAEQQMNHAVREDYSSFHLARYNSHNGEFIMGATIQGFSDSSTWSRGQSWVIYGFTTAYRYTQDERFLNTAIGAANYFIDRLPEDFIPYWDFDVPQNSSEPKDASSAAVVSSALLELVTFMDEGAEKDKFEQAAFNMIESLISDNYLADPNVTNAILTHSTAHKPANKRVDVPLIFADYYLLEALVRYEKYRKLTSIDSDENHALTAPKEFVLMQNYPNPFNPSTTIKYELKKSSYVRIKVYDVLGREIKELINSNQSAGKYHVNWNGENESGRKVSTGIFYYKMIAANFVAVNKMIFIK